MLENFDFITTFFQIYEQFGASWISQAQSVKPIFSLTVTLYLTENDNRTKQSLTQLSQYSFG